MQDNIRFIREQARATIARLPVVPGGTGGISSAVREFIGRQKWMERVANPVQDALKQGTQYLGPSTMDAVHGTWLGHPLHPALTDVPLGAATAAIGFDALGSATRSKRLELAADGALAVAVAGAVPTVAAGLADWTHVSGAPRRVGLVHAFLNITSVLLNSASLVLRFSGRRKSGVALSSVAYLAMTGAAWLGGEMVMADGIGVDHNMFGSGPRDFTPVMPEADLQEGRLERGEANGTSVLLFRRGVEVWAIGDTCSHQRCSLSRGHLEGDTVRCPCHGATFSLRDGSLIHGPSTYNQPAYEVRIWNGQIYVRQAPKVRQVA